MDGLDVGQRELRVDGPDGALDVLHKQLRAGARAAHGKPHIAIAANRQTRLPEVALQQRPIGDLGSLVIDAPVPLLTGHSDDLAIDAVGPLADALAQRGCGVAPKFSSQIRGDDRYRARFKQVRPIEVPASGQGVSHRDKVSRAKAFVRPDRRHLGVGYGPVFDIDEVHTLRAVRCHSAFESDGAHPGDFRQLGRNVAQHFGGDAGPRGSESGAYGELLLAAIRLHQQ